VYSIRSVLRCYKKGIKDSSVQFCTGMGEERTSAGGRGIAIIRSRYLARTSEDTTNLEQYVL
jgi:hypothetical protein